MSVLVIGGNKVCAKVILGVARCGVNKFLLYLWATLLTLT